MKNQFGQNTNENISKISALEVYYFKVSTKESLSCCKKKIDSLFVYSTWDIKLWKKFPRFLSWKFTTSRLTQKESLCSVCKKIDSVLY